MLIYHQFHHHQPHSKTVWTVHPENYVKPSQTTLALPFSAKTLDKEQMVIQLDNLINFPSSLGLLWRHKLLLHVLDVSLSFLLELDFGNAL